MFAVTLIGNMDEPLIKTLLVDTRLVAADQKNRLACRIEGKGNPPDFPLPTKAKLLHVGVFRAVEGIDRRAAKIWPELLQQEGMGKQFILQTFKHRSKFSGKFITEQNIPSHS